MGLSKYSVKRKYFKINIFDVCLKYHPPLFDTNIQKGSDGALGNPFYLVRQ